MRDRGNDLDVVAAGWGGEWWVSRFFLLETYSDPCFACFVVAGLIHDLP